MENGIKTTAAVGSFACMRYEETVQDGETWGIGRVTEVDDDGLAIRWRPIGLDEDRKIFGRRFVSDGRNIAWSEMEPALLEREGGNVFSSWQEAKAFALPFLVGRQMSLF